MFTSNIGSIKNRLNTGLILKKMKWRKKELEIIIMNLKI